MSSSEIAIRVENLGKRYIIGKDRPRPKSFGGKLGRLAASPFDWLRTQVKGPSEEEIFWALKDVSFELKKGEVLGVIGRNGAGKSTLLKILSRITEPTTGHAEIHGRVGSLLEVGTGMHPELTGRENIYLNGCTLGMKKAEIDNKFDEIVEFAGVGRFLDTPVKRYSSGMRVRLGFAIAAHLEPEVLIVDEVLAVGDDEFQKKCLGKMQDVAGHGRSVLFVSHNMDAVLSLCPQAILLANGEKEAEGSSQVVIERYIHKQPTGKKEYALEGIQINDPPAYISKIRIEDLEGTPRNNFAQGEKWQLRLFLKVAESIDQLQVAVGMNDQMNKNIRDTRTQPQKFDPGVYEIVFRESTISFAKGTYSLRAAVKRGSIYYQFTDDAGKIDIAEHTDASLSLRKTTGFILNPFETFIYPAK